jgi:hypothetical protein
MVDHALFHAFGLIGEAAEIQRPRGLEVGKPDPGSLAGALHQGPVKAGKGIVKGGGDDTLLLPQEMAVIEVAQPVGGCGAG